MSKHPVVHIEFSAKDVVSAAKFYSDLFGWEIRQMPEMNYATFQPGSGPGGGGRSRKDRGGRRTGGGGADGRRP